MSDALGRLPLACPLDGLALEPEGRSLVCGRGHVHDVSRHGYVNLLPVQFKPSRAPGDDAAMVAARRRVLDAGLFDPLGDALAEIAAGCLDSPDEHPDRGGTPPADARTPLLVDAGCGEGTHAAELARRLRERSGVTIDVLGTDISVHAVKAAARRHRDLGWAVANNTRLPVLAGRADIVVSLFGFETWNPWAALQASGQHVIVGLAGPRHLIELREAIYDDVRIHDPPSDAVAGAAGYRLAEERSVVREACGVAAGRVADVLAMTPHGHRGARDTTRASELPLGRDDRGDVPLTIDVVLRAYRRL